MRFTLIFGVVLLLGISGTQAKDLSFKKGMETQRLEIRPVRSGDQLFYHKVYADPLAMASFMHGGLLTSREIDTRYVQQVEVAKETPYTAHLLFLKGKRHVLANYVGQVILAPSGRYADELEIAYVLRPRYWNKGYTSEAVERVLDEVRSWRKKFPCYNSVFRKTSKVERLYATVRENNIPSRKILKHNNFQPEGGASHKMYAYTRKIDPAED